MLVGRVRECREIDDLLSHVREGASGGLVVRGEPGIGKTVLLDYARARADGMTIVSAVGVEAESELPFAGLAELLRPLLGRLDVIPAPQRAALEGALALGPPVPADPFAVSTATLSLLAAGAADSALLAVVDDAHWLDAASAQAILFAARRLEREGVALLLAAREDSALPLARAGLPELTVTGLDDESAQTLLERGGRPPAARVARAVLETARGNPLALIEIPNLLTEAQREGTAPLVEPLPLGDALGRAFMREIEALTEPARDALVVAAAAGPEPTTVVSTAVAAFGGDADALEEAEAAGILALDDTIRFRHPLLRAAAYHRAPPGTRRRAHRAIATALSSMAHGTSRPWHLALGSSAPNEEAAAALAELAEDARRRTGVAAAAAAFERSARLTTETGLRSQRLVEAARGWLLAGQVGRASELLEEALPGASNPRFQAEIAELQSQCEFYAGAPAVAHALLVEAASRVEPVAPAQAVRLLAQAAGFKMGSGEPRVALELSERATRIAERADDESQLLADLRLTEALFLLGERDRAEIVLDRCLVSLADADPLGAFHLYQGPALTLIYLERYAAGRSMLTRAIAAARQASAPTLLPLPMAVLALADFRTGNWRTAHASASEAVRLGDETGQATVALYLLSILARLEAALGRVDDCRAASGRALELSGAGITPALHWARAPLGFLALSLGDYEEAISHLEPIARDAAETGLENPAFTQWPPDLVEAYARSGRSAEADAALGRLERQAERTRLAWARAAAARCRGLLAPDDAFEAELERALAWHDRTPTPFERARTQLVLGERRRRAGRRVEAREPLRAAFETFDWLGARLWAERAAAELQATGQRARPHDPTADEELTAQEFQVALAIAGGARNREAAAALFLSPKTVEYHLTHIYRKLGIRSRSELARRFAHDVDPPAGAVTIVQAPAAAR